MICRVMRNPRELKVRRYAARLIGINEYFFAFPGEKSSFNIVETKLNKLLLNSIPGGWIKQACMQGFDCENIPYVNMFECMEISETRYGDVAEPSY